MKKIFFSLCLLFYFSGYCSAQSNNKTELLELPQYVQNKASPNAFQIIANRKSAKIFVDSQDWKGVVRAANDLSDDVRKVSGTAYELVQFNLNNTLKSANRNAAR